VTAKLSSAFSPLIGTMMNNFQHKTIRQSFLMMLLLFSPLAIGQEPAIEVARDSESATATPTSAGKSLASVPEGFHLQGERWTYRNGDLLMNGILIKPDGKGPFPAVLISHGLGGSSEGFGLPKAREMVKWGFVCIAPDYTHSAKFNAGGRRGAPGPGAPRDASKAPPSGGNAKRGMPRDYVDYGASEENIRRAKTCLELLSKMSEVDTQRLAAYGHSMGGFVTIGLAAKEPKLLKAAAISGSGVAARDGFPAPSAARTGAIRTPFLMLHGSLDNVVGPQQSADLQAILDKNQVPNDRKVFEGENHPIDQTKRDEVFAAIRDWFEQHGVLVSPFTQQEGRKGGSPPAATVPDRVKAYRDLAYVENGHERHKLDLFIPEGTKEPLPLIIWIHGGGWQNGSKDGCPPLRNGYTERGYAVASINYRLSGHAIFPAQIEDCKAAIRWLRAHAAKYNLDSQRFGVWGSSAGGHLVALVGTSGNVKALDVGANLDQSSRVQAVCDYYGPTDFTVFVTTPGYASHATANSPEAKLIGGAVMENKDKASSANPITYMSQDDPPFLIVHGDKDPTVPINQSQLLYDALKQAGVNVHFHTIKGASHGQGFGGPEIEPMVIDFFDRVLKANPLPSNLGPAKTSDSDASPAPAAAKGNAGAPRRAGNMGWEQVRRIEGVDNDGRVSRNQFRGPPAMFDRLDRNRDGFVSKEDFN
jgi:acetyl esterase/lipase